MNKHDTEIHIPWYKNYILLLIIFIPLATVCGSMYTIYLAISSSDSPVLESYYKTGVAPNKDRGAANIVHGATIDNQVLILDRAEESIEPLTLILEHPTIAASDQAFTLMAKAPNQYPVPDEVYAFLAKQRWYVKLYANKEGGWRLAGSTHAGDDTITFHAP